MERLMKSIKIASIMMLTIIAVVATMAYFSAKREVEFVNREKATLEYYESVETLLDSLYIDGGDTIFETDAGAKYLESKYTFDSLFINNNYDRRN